MKKLPDSQWLQQFRQRLDDTGYHAAGLLALLGSPNPPTPSQMPHAMHLTRSITPLNTCLRLFLLGQSVATTSARETLSEQFIDDCIDLQLLVQTDNRLHASIVIVPVDDLLFASDAFRMLGTPEAREFVLPASTHSANFLRQMTLREEVERCLDLGCGCGIHALFAARHARKVVATDISAAAIQYTAFNAILNNIDNIEWFEGDLFEPLKGQTFDLIVSNPPFVIGPGQQFVYRDNTLQLDDFCREIVQQAGRYLNDGGHLQMLCEWVEVRDKPWRERLTEWIAGSQCDAWILRSTALTPTQYVAQRSGDLAGEGTQSHTHYTDWLQYFAEHEVHAIDPGMIVLRRRNAHNWIHFHSLSSEPGIAAGDALAASIASCDFLDLCKDDASLAEATLAISTDVRLEQQFTRAEHGWQSSLALLHLGGGLPADAEVDLPILAFLQQLDGDKTLGDTISSFADSVAADATELSRQLIPAVRALIERGLIVTAA